MRIVSAKRRQRWRKKLRDIDRMVAGRGARRIGAAPILWLVASRALTWLGVWIVLAAAGTVVGVGTMAALATAGTLISYASTLVPLGLGLSEGGNAALFVALGQSASLGVTLVISRRLIQVIYAAIGIGFVATAGTIQKARAYAAGRPVSSSGTAAEAYPHAS
jgi:hypothetical protein